MPSLSGGGVSDLGPFSSNPGCGPVAHLVPGPGLAGPGLEVRTENQAAAMGLSLPKCGRDGLPCPLGLLRVWAIEGGSGAWSASMVGEAAPRSLPGPFGWVLVMCLEVPPGGACAACYCLLSPLSPCPTPVPLGKVLGLQAAARAGKALRPPHLPSFLCVGLRADRMLRAASCLVSVLPCVHAQSLSQPIGSCGAVLAAWGPSLASVTGTQRGDVLGAPAAAGQDFHRWTTSSQTLQRHLAGGVTS